MAEETAPEWLGGIKLVTFDCFGSLIDWRAGLDKVEIRTDEDFRDFEKRCLVIQQAERHTPYARVLKEVIAAMKPDLRRAIVGLFADDFGRMPAFGDSARALSSLKEMVKVGVLTNCDANHQLDVMSTLRVAWDVCITSQDIRAYKPTDRAWDTIVRMGVARTAVAPDSWLHVSAFGSYDLQPAKARRLRTCHVQRPGGEERSIADIAVKDLDELVEVLAEAKSGPLLLEVRNTAADYGTRHELRQWLAHEHIGRVRAVAGVTDARLIEDEDQALVEQYTFGGKLELDAYRDAFEAEHQGSVRDRFGGLVTRKERLLRVRGRA